MRVGISSTVAALLALATQLAATQAENVNVKAVSFNVRTSYAGEDRQSTCANWFGVRQKNVVAQFHAADADFVGTQETTDEQKAFLDGALAATYQSIGVSGGSLNGMAAEVNALYYKFADWAKLDEKTFWLGPNPDVQSAAWGMQYYRTAVFGRFQHIKTGTTVCIFNTHYETPGQIVPQMEASKIINAKRAELCQPGDKLEILMGDLNNPPHVSSITLLSDAGWKEESTDSTYCSGMVSASCSIKYDYTKYRLNGEGCQVEAKVLREPFEGGCYASDHAALSGTWCLGPTCCGATDAPTEAPTTPPVARDAGSSSSSGAVVEAEIKPGVVVPSGGNANGPANPVLASGGETAADADSSAVGAGDSTATETNSQSANATNATGTVAVIIGVLAAVAGVCAFVIKKKHALEAQLDGEKSVFAPARAMFNRSEHDALSPVRRATRAIARKFSSPVPTLEPNGEDHQRSFSQTSSIPCSRRSSLPLSIEEDNFNSRLSSPVLLGNARGIERGSSRVYFSEVATDRNPRSDFAML